MKKKLFSWMTIIVMAFMCAGFASCGGDDDDDDSNGSGSGTVSGDIVGKWVAQGGKRTATYVFESNGTGKSSYYFGSSSGYWVQGEGVFTWERNGKTIKVKGGYWAEVNSDEEISEGTYDETFEYNGTTLTGGRFGDASIYTREK